MGHRIRKVATSSPWLVTLAFICNVSLAWSQASGGTDQAKEGEAERIQGYPIFSVYELDLSTMEITAPPGSVGPNRRNLPFDVPFLLRVKGTQQVKTLDLGLRELRPHELRLPGNDCTATMKDDLAAKKKAAEDANLAMQRAEQELKDAAAAEGSVKAEKAKQVKDAKETYDKAQKAYEDLVATPCVQLDCDCGRCAFNRCISSFKRQPLLTGDVVVAVPALKANTFYAICMDITAAPTKLDSARLRDFLITTIASKVKDDLVAWKLNQVSQDQVTVRVATHVREQARAYLDHVYVDSQRYTSVASNVDKVIADDALKGPLDVLFSSADRLTDVLASSTEAAGVDKPFLKELFGNEGDDKNLWGMFAKGSKVPRLSDKLIEITSVLGTEQMITDVKEVQALLEKEKAQRKTKNGKPPADKAAKKRLEMIDAMIDYVSRLMVDLERHGEVLQQLNKEVEVLTDRLVIDVLNSITLVGSTSGDFKTRASWYLAPDVGYAFVYGESRPIQQTPYFGVQLHLSPINREANYSLFMDQGIRNKNGKWTWKGAGRKIAKSLSFSVGLTTTNISEVEDRRGVVGDEMGLLIGGGLRLNEFLRVGCGSLLTQRRVEQPLNDTFALNSNFYWGVSIDIDLIGYFQRMIAARATKPTTN